MSSRPCFECGTPHTTDKPRCPACEGVREYHRNRLKGLVGVGQYFSERAFEFTYGPERP